MQGIIRFGGAVFMGALLASPAAAQDQTAIANGAGVYGRTCARCHNLRSPTERTDREWAVIVSHMRSRANLIRSDAADVLAFLRATNGDDTPSSTPETSASANAPQLAKAHEDTNRERRYKHQPQARTPRDTIATGGTTGALSVPVPQTPVSPSARPNRHRNP